MFQDKEEKYAKSLKTLSKVVKKEQINGLVTTSKNILCIIQLFL